MKIFTVKTAEHGTVVNVVENSRDAVRILRELAADGIKCVRWEMQECA